MKHYMVTLSLIDEETGWATHEGWPIDEEGYVHLQGQLGDPHVVQELSIEEQHVMASFVSSDAIKCNCSVDRTHEEGKGTL